MSFREFILSENTTTPLLRTQFRPEIVQAAVTGVTNRLKKTGTWAWTRNIPPDRVGWLVKWQEETNTYISEL